MISWLCRDLCMADLARSSRELRLDTFEITPDLRLIGGSLEYSFVFNDNCSNSNLVTSASSSFNVFLFFAIIRSGRIEVSLKTKAIGDI